MNDMQYFWSQLRIQNANLTGPSLVNCYFRISICSLLATRNQSPCTELPFLYLNSLILNLYCSKKCCKVYFCRSEKFQATGKFINFFAIFASRGQFSTKRTDATSISAKEPTNPPPSRTSKRPRSSGDYHLTHITII